MKPIHALAKAGYPAQRMIVHTMQAVSGAGYPGVPSLDMIDNIIPYIGGEEEKSEKEPLKVFGRIENGIIANAEFPKISAHCNRVPVVDGHTACVSLEFAGKKPSSMEEIKAIWAAYKGLPQDENFPMAPKQPIYYREEDNRPQPRKDRDIDKQWLLLSDGFVPVIFLIYGLWLFRITPFEERQAAEFSTRSF